MKIMHEFSFPREYLLLCLFLVIGLTTTVSGDALNWTNGDLTTVYNTPDKPTLVTFNDCVKILTISTYHWNYGNGDIPGSVGLNHEDGTRYGPWRTYGQNGTYNAPELNWIATPHETLKAGTYLISDSNPGTWAQNDGSDNRGIATIEYERVNCSDDTGDIPALPDEPGTGIPDESIEGVTLTPDDIDVATLPGGATNKKKLPKIEQVGFTSLNRNMSGGQNVYATLRIKNTGNRDLEFGYVIIRFISQDGTSSYRGGMGKIPRLTVGEERDISLIIPTTGPIHGENSSNTLYCAEYILDGSVSELMKGGYFESRGVIRMSPENLIAVTGCCQEPYTMSTLRGC